MAEQILNMRDVAYNQGLNTVLCETISVLKKLTMISAACSKKAILTM